MEIWNRGFRHHLCRRRRYGNKFEAIRDTLSNAVCRKYDEAQTYHDGKWVMFEPTDTTEFDDYMKLLAIKRKTNRK